MLHAIHLNSLFNSLLTLSLLKVYVPRHCKRVRLGVSGATLRKSGSTTNRMAGGEELKAA